MIGCRYSSVGCIVFQPVIVWWIRYRLLMCSLLFLFPQAFLEMADESAATTMVTYFTTCVAQLRGRAVYVQFSNHKELKTDQTHSNAVSSSDLPLSHLLSGACSSEVKIFCVYFLLTYYSIFHDFHIYRLPVATKYGIRWSPLKNSWLLLGLSLLKLKNLPLPHLRFYQRGSLVYSVL